MVINTITMQKPNTMNNSITLTNCELAALSGGETLSDTYAANAAAGLDYVGRGILASVQSGDKSVMVGTAAAVGYTIGSAIGYYACWAYEAW
jgi:hypothetical protein